MNPVTTEPAYQTLHNVSLRSGLMGKIVQMDEKWIHEYVDRQYEIGMRLAKKGVQDQSNISLTSLVEWEFKVPYSNCLFGLPISAQIPFFEQLIMRLRPYHTENDFRAAYGLSVQEILDLWRKKRLLVTALDPNRYVGLDYLDPLLENDPPYLEPMAVMFCRTVADLVGGEEYFDSCYDVALAKIRQSKSLMERMPDKMPVLPYRTDTKDGYLSGLAAAYATLCGFGYEELASSLLADTSYTSIGALLKYNELLVFYPRYAALDGVVTVKPSDFQISTQLGLVTKAQPFPVDVAKLLTKKLPIVLIKDIGWDQIVEVRGKTAELRRLLFEIDQCASSGEFEKLPRQDALERAFEQAKIASLEIARTKKWSTVGVHALVGILGGAAGVALAGLPGLLASTTIGVLGAIPFAEKTAEAVSKLKKKSHAIAYFDVEHSLKLE